MGGGSNVLFLDSGFDGLVIRLENDFITKEKEGEKIIIKTGAGTSLARLVDFAAKEGLTGLEWATGIPGTVGGAVVGNAGAFGREMKDLVRKADAVFWKNKGSLKKQLSITSNANLATGIVFSKTTKKLLFGKFSWSFCREIRRKLKKR